jgi:alpha-beta hydrolase superfamily lysophospholipase
VQRGAAVSAEHPAAPPYLGDVVYVHGSTFGADLSVFHRLDRRSWADALNDAGLTVWGFDWAGYGRSGRYPPEGDEPVGRMADALPQLRRVLAAIRHRNGNRPVALVAHSWGASVAASYASRYPQDVSALVLFGPIVPRAPGAAAASVPAPAAAPLPSHYAVSIWAQYRRFVEDVPRGQAQVLGEAHFEAWNQAYLATDCTADTRSPPSVWTPSGPMADVRAWWSGEWLYEPARVLAPTLLVRGAWDSLCTDADAAKLLAALGSPCKADCRIDRATHLMHLEQQRGAMYQRVNTFLLETLVSTPFSPSEFS